MNALIRTLKKNYPGLQQWAYNFSGFNQYGLYRDDLISDTPDVIEALRRLPPHLLDERNFRLVRAMQLTCQKKILPREQWSKLEEDVHYLLPYLEEVIRERQEREKWEAQ